ncbi:uncharacterized protein [Penaeus vannamei]|uniref:uncharacterized protein n=1 Tax=Penaeus vannamei TaxID=6689 RepID=UPI00387FAB94
MIVPLQGLLTFERTTTSTPNRFSSFSSKDDIVLLSESADEMQQLLNDLNRGSLKVGLKMNKKKTKVMFNSRDPSEQILVQGEALEVVDKLLERKLKSAQRGMERSMVGINLRDRKRATWIREQTKVEDIIGSIKKKKW